MGQGYMGPVPSGTHHTHWPIHIWSINQLLKHEPFSVFPLNTLFHHKPFSPMGVRRLMCRSAFLVSTRNCINFVHLKIKSTLFDRAIFVIEYSVVVFFLWTFCRSELNTSTSYHMLLMGCSLLFAYKTNMFDNDESVQCIIQLQK